ncbi:hypothetical protein ACQR1H_03085 [Bradyrhizobium sp. HKCCYLRH2015]|uniref:hypothetical protein n=1 Tax=Bradyrhizobium sp. HKCCYLRH2015 TaxID=3420742 RepID=UPI003EBBAA1F
MSSDNDPLPFQPIGTFAARLLQSDKQQNENCEGDTATGRDDQQQTGEHREYVEKRLRELAAFERRARGESNRR